MAEQVVRVGVVGDESSAGATALSGAGLEPIQGEPRTVLDADVDVAVAVGESALLELARLRPQVPVLPVDAGAGFRSVPESRLAGASERLAGRDWATESHPLLAVEHGTGESLAAMDVMLVTSEPAHISEFTVTAGGERIARFRADGVVAAAPAGTTGYAGRAGAPVVQPGSEVVAVVPIAPFATNLDHWVLPADGLTITVERDAATIDVLADDRTVGTASKGTPVDVSTGGSLETVRLPEGRSPFARHGTELEKL